MTSLPRIIYYAAELTSSISPIATSKATQVYLCQANMGPNLPAAPPNPASPNPYLHLNDIPLADPNYKQLWTDVTTIQAAGIQVMFMLGGAGAKYQGTDPQGYAYNNNTWGLLWPGPDQVGVTYHCYTDSHGSAVTTGMDQAYYTLILYTLKTYKLDGIGLDFESGYASSSDVEGLIAALRNDYKQQDLVVSLTPVATGLSTGNGLSGFNYQTVYEAIADQISSLNGQFYNGFGTVTQPGTGSPSNPGFEDVINVKWGAGSSQSFPSNKVVLGAELSQITDDYDTYLRTVNTLYNTYKDADEFGGVFAWLYGSAVPTGTNATQWASDVYDQMQGSS